MAKIKAPTWFWVVAVIALIWNIMGVLAYIGSVTLSPEQLEAMSEQERMVRENTPAWATGAYALATFGGALGCLLLLLRKSLATMLFYLSFICIVVQMYYGLFVANSVELFGLIAVIMPILVIVIGFLLILLSRKATKEGWIG